MKSLSIRFERPKNMIAVIKHDLRLYDDGPRPSYINHEKTKENIVLFMKEDSPKSSIEIQPFIQRLDEENRTIFKSMRDSGKIGKNQGYKITEPFVSGILTLSREVQQEIQNEEKRKIFFKKVKEYLEQLSKGLGVEIIYAVIHMDEQSPHIHFTFRNLRTSQGNFFGIETTEKTIGKSLSGSLFVPPPGQAHGRVREYFIPYETVQDSLDFFSDIGFGRGVKKTERLQKGATRYETVHMTVKELHENLPKQLAERKAKMLAELREYERQLEKAYQEAKNSYEKRLSDLKLEYQKRITELERQKENELRSLKEKYEKEIADEKSRLERQKENELRSLKEKYEKEIQKIKEQYAQDKETYMQLEKGLIEKHNKLLNQIENAQVQIKDLQKEINELNITKTTAEKECVEKEKEVKQLSQEIKILAITKNMLEELIEVREKAEKQVKSQMKSKNQGFRLDM